MKYVFFGTPRFAEIVLRGLLGAGMPPAALVCNPDRPVGRKKTITPPPTKTLLLDAGGASSAPVFQPEQMDDRFLREIAALKPDLFIVAAYAKIIPHRALVIPRLGAIGVHPSLLPKYRGASPIQSAILNGDAETGVTLYIMDEKMDHGPVVAQAKVPFDPLRTDYPALEAKLAEKAASLLLQTMPAASAGELKPQEQDESHASFTKKFTSDDGRVDERDLALAERGDAAKAETILRTMNALRPEPGAWTIKGGKRLKLLKGILGADGSLVLTLVQPEGGKPRPA